MADRPMCQNATDYPLTAEECSLLHRGTNAKGRSELIRELNAAGAKYCGRCKTLRPLSEFGADRTMWDGLNTKCRLCHISTTLEWQRGNPDAYRRYTQARREERREKSRRWTQAHPEKALANSARSRARKYGAVPDWCEAGTECGNRVDEMYYLARIFAEGFGVPVYHVDHVTALENGGLHVPDNLALLTAPENFRKGARDSYEHPTPQFHSLLFNGEPLELEF